MLGTITGILTLFPFQQWRHSHNVHHATSSNLNKRGTGDIWVMTVEEYARGFFLAAISLSILSKSTRHVWYRSNLFVSYHEPFKSERCSHERAYEYVFD